MLDAVLLLLRWWLGSVMLAHGYHHARSIEGTARWFASKGFRRSRLAAIGSAVGELAIGAGLVTGLLTSLAAAGVVAVMFTAFWTVHRYAGFFVFHRPDEGWEYVATLTVVATAIAVLGPGRFSFDAVLGWAGSMDGWVGVGAVAAGVAVGGLQLAANWSRPEPGLDQAGE